jgi:hypothetical protein
VQLMLINDTPKLVFFLYPSFLCFHTNKNMNDVQPPSTNETPSYRVPRYYSVAEIIFNLPPFYHHSNQRSV